jgi:hypothetical protein
MMVVAADMFPYFCTLRKTRSFGNVDAFGDGVDDAQIGLMRESKEAEVRRGFAGLVQGRGGRLDHAGHGVLEHLPPSILMCAGCLGTAPAPAG